MAALDLDNNEDEIYSLFESKSNFNLQDNESYRKLLQSAQGNRPNSSRNIPLRIGTSTGVKLYHKFNYKYNFISFHVVWTGHVSETRVKFQTDN